MRAGMVGSDGPARVAIHGQGPGAARPLPDRLSCCVDQVGGIVSSTRPDTKNARYQETIKQGDLLLNRVQKLSRVINL